MAGRASSAACRTLSTSSFFSSRRRHTRYIGDWSSDVCSSDLQRAEDFVGRPMLSALLGTYAAWAGDRAGARRWFESGYAEFVQEPFTEANEFSPRRFPDKPRVGPFMANQGGFLMSCLFGLTGLRLNAGEPAGWFTRSVVLPEGWEAIEVDRLYVRGRPMRLVARQGEARARLEPTAGLR